MNYLCSTLVNLMRYLVVCILKVKNDSIKNTRPSRDHSDGLYIHKTFFINSNPNIIPSSAYTYS